MNTTRWWTALAAALLLVCPPLLGQSAAGDTPTRDPTPDSTDDSTTASGNVAPAPVPGDNSAEPPQRREESPFDYRASEQISEDLSVSFPVDI